MTHRPKFGMVCAAKCTFHDLASALAELDRHYMNVRQEAAIRPGRIYPAFSKDTDEKLHASVDCRGT